MHPFHLPSANKQKSQPSSNPLKQLFSHNLSPKHKLSDQAKPKNHLPTSRIQLQNKYVYSFDDLIGDGFTSKVYKGYDIDKQTKPYAIKVIEKSRLNSDQIKLIKNEIELHPKLDHKNIVKCYDVFDTPKFIYIVLELCQNGDLAQYLLTLRDKNIPEYRTIQIMEHILEGCRYLVQQGILHRDLKPQNILRAGNTFKIADFGFAVKGKKTLIDEMNVGTPLYMPPQAIEECVYSHKSDFFSLGVIMYEIINGQTPWYKNDEKALAKAMRNGQMNLSKIKNPNIKYFIEKTCEISEGHRMSVDEFMQFDFRETQLRIQFSSSAPLQELALKPQKPVYVHTDRILSSPQIVSPDNTCVKSARSKKSEATMEATFVSNHIYFKTAKCEDVKKITADFQEKFEFCLLLKYLIENSDQYLLLEDFDKKNLRIVLFRHCIFTLKKLINQFTQTKSFDSKSWLDYKQTQEFQNFEQQCKTIKEKMEKQFNLQLKGMSLKNLSEVNKRFPQLSTQYELSKSFYEKLKQFLKEMMRKLHPEVLKKMAHKSLNLLSPVIQNPNSGYFEAFKSLYRYHESCDQKLCQEDVNKSFAFYTSSKNQQGMNNSNVKMGAGQNGSNMSSTLQVVNSKKDYLFSSPFSTEGAGFGKSVNGNHLTHLSPECDKTVIISPKSKHMLNKTAGKNFFNSTNNLQEAKTQTKVSQFAPQNSSKPHHYYAYGGNQYESQANKTEDSTVVSVYSPTKRLLTTKTDKNVRDSVESHFEEVLCKNYAESKMTKEEMIAIKKKIKWLW